MSAEVIVKTIPLEIKETDCFYAEFNVKNDELWDVTIRVTLPANLWITPTNAQLKTGENCDFLVHLKPEFSSEPDYATILVVSVMTSTGEVVALTEYVVKVVRGGRQKFTRKQTTDKPINPIFESECFRCKICLLEYDDTLQCPRVLTCGHTVCTKCSESIWNREDPKRMRCPFDRTETKVKDIKLLPKNFVLLEILQVKYPEASEGRVLALYEKIVNLEKLMTEKKHRLKFLEACFALENPLIKEKITWISEKFENERRDGALEKFDEFVKNQCSDYQKSREKVETELPFVKIGLDSVEKYLESENREEYFEEIIEKLEMINLNCTAEAESSSSQDPATILTRFVASLILRGEENNGQEAESDDSDSDTSASGYSEDEDDPSRVARRSFNARRRARRRARRLALRRN